VDATVQVVIDALRGRHSKRVRDLVARVQQHVVAEELDRRRQSHLVSRACIDQLGWYVGLRLVQRQALCWGVVCAAVKQGQAEDWGAACWSLLACQQLVSHMSHAL
jgi:hypothetical protein